jgi:hypothetical protein
MEARAVAGLQRRGYDVQVVRGPEEMKTVEAIGIVDESGELIVRVHTNMPPGRLPVELILPDEPEKESGQRFHWPVFSVGTLPPDFSLSREDLYDDNGR